MPLFLEVASGRNAGLKIPVKDRRFLIGRAEDCDLRAHSEQVSRYHCAIVVEDHGVFVRDYGSRNGTFVDRSRIQSQRRLTDGAEIRVGPLVFIMRFGERPESSIGETVEGRQLETLADAPPETSATPAPTTMPTETESPPLANRPKPPVKFKPRNETEHAAEAGLRRMFAAPPKKKPGE